MHNVLLVDDREIFRYEAMRMGVWGAGTGFRIEDTANNGYEAIQKLCGKKYDLVITDIRMPIMDGMELLQEIKRGDLCPCVILLSEHAEFEYARRGLIMGAFDYIIKPLAESALRSTLERAGSFLECSALHNDMPDKALENAYFHIEEDVIAGFMMHGTQEAVHIFRKAAAGFSMLLEQDISKLTKALDRLYFNLLTRVTRANEWLHAYVNLSSYYQQCYFGVDSGSLIQYYAEKLESLLLLLRQFKPAAGKGIVPDACDYVIEHVDSQISLRSVADSLYINHTYLSYRFKRETGRLFIDYITFVKMERARFLLETTCRKSSEISTMMGYSDSDYFGRLFKKHTSKSPSEYKKLLSSQKII